MRYFFLIVVFLSAVSLCSGQGSIKGTLKDNQTGESLIAANVLVLGTKLGAITDLDGNYLIKQIPEGVYSVRFAMVGYANKVVEGVKIETGKTVTLSVGLESETYQTNEVVIKADMVYNNESALLTKRKETAAISDGVSAEQIKRTPDATSGDALKRVTGLTLVDNKFVYVRGITDRYNGTTLDGASVTSTEAGKKGFSFDLLPSNLLENTSVIKSATPDLPGDFSGGLVQLNTLDFPAKRTIKVSLSTARNEETTLRDFYFAQGGAQDWLGFDDGSRELPAGNQDAMQVAKTAPNNWAPRKSDAPFNGGGSLVYGDRIVFNQEEPTQNQLGFVTSLSYKNGFQKSLNLYDNDYGVKTGPKDEYSVLWGAIANISYQIDGIHKFMFKNNFNQSASDIVENTNSHNGDVAATVNQLSVNWTQRSIYTGQLAGEHHFPEIGGLIVQWRSALSSSTRRDPDSKQVEYYKWDDYPDDDPEVGQSRRLWSHLNDRGYAFNTDFTLPILSSKFKFGAFYEKKATNYVMRFFEVTGDFPGADSINNRPIETVFAPENFGPGKFKFNERTRNTDQYDGNSEMISSYAMIDISYNVFGNMLRYTGGARVENSTTVVNTRRSFKPGDPFYETELRNIDVLPSMNLTYNFNNSMNVRFAYSHSVNRPDFREMAITDWYDFEKNEYRRGNPDLQRAFIHNYDIRYEMFPEIGELFALSYFRKTFSNAIEEQLENNTNPQRTWMNSSYATAYGWEFEMRKSLGFIGSYFENFSLSANYTRMISSVEYQYDAGNSEHPDIITATRPLQGQSPYVINLSFMFTEPRFGTSVSILYNKFGSRLDASGVRISDIYEQPRDIVDLAITQPLFSLLEAKLTIKNLNGKPEIFTRDEKFYKSVSKGPTYSLQVSAGL